MVSVCHTLPWGRAEARPADEFVDDLAVADGSYDDHRLAFRLFKAFGVADSSCRATYALHVICQHLRSDVYHLVVVCVHKDESRHRRSGERKSLRNDLLIHFGEGNGVVSFELAGHKRKYRCKTNRKPSS